MRSEKKSTWTTRGRQNPEKTRCQLRKGKQPPKPERRGEAIMPSAYVICPKCSHRCLESRLRKSPYCPHCAHRFDLSSNVPPVRVQDLFPAPPPPRAQRPVRGDELAGTHVPLPWSFLLAAGVTVGFYAIVYVFFRGSYIWQLTAEREWV